MLSFLQVICVAGRLKTSVYITITVVLTLALTLACSPYSLLAYDYFTHSSLLACFQKMTCFLFRLTIELHSVSILPESFFVCHHVCICAMTFPQVSFSQSTLCSSKCLFLFRYSLPLLLGVVINVF